MFETLVSNLKLIGILMAMFVGSFSVNTLLGIYANVAEAKEQFSKEKLLQGIARGLIVLIGCFILTVIISLLPEMISALGIVAEDGILENISIVGMSGVIVSMIFRYLKDALEKFYNILYNEVKGE